ncbi:ABC transporter substrate-binding protein [Dendrosporobacter sp. 1207_IL3150]|uniref:ABC transporter substrate-binding protein n=1 Tax=Dendrosporobacter sp. 1207_IL3150 TaxID=3084054 RepID=UPI002FDAADE1
MRRLFWFLIIMLLVILLSGCNRGQSGLTPGQWGYEFKDYQGYIVKLPGQPQRIVSLSIGTDEILVDLVPIERIAALSAISEDTNISCITEQAKLVANKVRANPEQIIALQPDLVLIPDWHSGELIQILRDAGVNVYVYHTPTNIEEVKQSITELARVLGAEARGTTVITKMDRELAAVTERVHSIPHNERKTVIRFTLMGGTDGKGSLFEDMCKLAGVNNGASLACLNSHDILSKEQIVQINPDVFIMPTWDYSGKTDMKKYYDDIRNDPGLQAVKAIQNDRLVAADGKYQDSSSQYIVYGIRDIANAAYPQDK